MADVFLHVGLPKTGTTTIQAALDASAERLGADGVLFPGGNHRAQRMAVYDLLGQRVRGEERGEVAGALGRLTAEVAAHRGRGVIISEEELALARPRHVRTLVRALGNHQVSVVVGARDMARTIVSAWQQTTVNGGTTPWRDFAASVREQPGAAPSEGISFWLRHDLLRVVDTWSTAVPLDRIHVVTVPPPGSGNDVLLNRFAEALRLSPDAWSAVPDRARNVSLGAAELEVVRRLNVAVAGRLNTSQHRFVIEAGIRSRLVGAGGRPLVLPEEHHDWARSYGERLSAEVRRRGLRVHGDLADLVATPSVAQDPPMDALDDADVLAATEAALASLALDHGRLFRRYRVAFVEREGRWPSPAEVVGSEARAAGFHLRKWGLRQADRWPPMAGAARGYLTRTSPSRIRP